MSHMTTDAGMHPGPHSRESRRHENRNLHRMMNTTLPTTDRLKAFDRIGLALVVIMSLMPLTAYTFFG